MLSPGSSKALKLALYLAAVAAVAAVLIGAMGRTSDERVATTSNNLGPAELELPTSATGALLASYSPNGIISGLAPRPAGWRTAAAPLAPGSLLESADAEPLEIGTHPSLQPSPDGRLLAIAAEGSSEISVLDVEAWQVVSVIEVERGVQPRHWSQDGRRVYAARHFCPSPAGEGRCPGGWLRDLWEIDIAAETARLLVEVDFEASRWHFNEEKGIAVTLALRTETCCGIDPQGAPFIAVADLEAGVVATEIELPDLLIGQPRHWLGDTSWYALYSPATALSPAGDLLYVVDSVDHVVYRTDVNEGTLIGVTDLQEPRSRFSRAMGWVESLFVGRAEAKGGPAYHRQAQLTPDGRYLITSGRVALEDELSSDPYEWKDRPAGLLVVDTATMEVVYRDKNASAFVLNPDGRWLVSYGSFTERVDDEPETRREVAFGLRLIDLRHLEQTAHLWPEQSARPTAISPDGRFVYVTVNGPGMVTVAAGGTRCTKACLHLFLVELASGEVADERLLDERQSVISLVSLW